MTTKPTSWPYRLWPISGLWAPRRCWDGLYRELKALNWEWSGRMKLPLWLRVWVWIDPDVENNHRLAEKYARARKRCNVCGAGNLPIISAFCMHCGEEIYEEEADYYADPDDPDPDDWYECCDSPIDMGHMDGCPENPENLETPTLRLVK